MTDHQLLDAINGLSAKIEAVTNAHEAIARCQSWAVVCFAERYPGTAGWVGAIGSIAALIVAMGIFLLQNRAEFASRRKDRNRQIELISDIIDAIESKIQPDMHKARLGFDASLYGLMGRIMNTPEWSAGSDLGRTKILEWPSKECYDQFRIYWLNTCGSIDGFDKPSNAPYLTKADVDGYWRTVVARIQARDDALTRLRAALNSVRV